MAIHAPRDWMVLLIGGPSGTGKSSIAYEISRFYGVSVLEADDIYLSVKAMTNSGCLPAIHRWGDEADWQAAGIQGNVSWLIDVGREMIPALKAIVQRHIEDKVPVIIEGDFISPDLVKLLDHPLARAVFLREDIPQIVGNYLAREGGEPQRFRAEVSAAYGRWIEGVCSLTGCPVIAARPWETALTRVLDALSV